MKKYTDGYYIYEYIDFICLLNLKPCDGCNRSLIGFVYELKIQSLDNERVTYCTECMKVLALLNVEWNLNKMCLRNNHKYWLCLNTKHSVANSLKSTYQIGEKAYNTSHQDVALIAQLDRALGYELRGREFESLWAHQLDQDWKNRLIAVFLCLKNNNIAIK